MSRPNRQRKGDGRAETEDTRRDSRGDYRIPVYILSRVHVRNKIIFLLRFSHVRRRVRIIRVGKLFFHFFPIRRAGRLRILRVRKPS